MGRISAILGLVVGVILALVETWAIATGWPEPELIVLGLLAALLLVTAGYRTLKKMKGGLRLLCGAWGLTAGMVWVSVAPFAETLSQGDAETVYALLLPVSLAGLALTVLHKE